MGRHRRKGPSPRTIRALQGLSALTVLAVLIGQLASIGHYVLVAHYFCALHGTMHHGRPPVAQMVVAPHARRAAVTSTVVFHHGVHDDCAFPARHRDATEPPSSTAAPIAAPAAVATPLAACEAPASSGIALLAQAPKQSPPARV